MNVLVVGYGSIGKRHVHNLLEMDCVDGICVYTRTRDGSGISGKNKLTFADASVFGLNDLCKQQKFDFAVIANETQKHVDTAITIAGNSIDLFIEKPLSHSLQDIDVLEEIARQRELKIFIAYNLRFLPAIKHIKDIISRKEIGDLYFARIEVGQYLPAWRKNINYKDSYSASVERGGGVALDLSHEVDYMRYLFGDPYMWKTVKTKASDLKIDTDDIFEGIYQYRNGFICSVHMDYLQSEAKREIRIAGSQGDITCDLVGKWMEIRRPDNALRLTEKAYFEIEDTYTDELRHFIDIINERHEPAITIQDGVKALKLLEDGHDR